MFVFVYRMLVYAPFHYLFASSRVTTDTGEPISGQFCPIAPTQTNSVENLDTMHNRLSVRREKQIMCALVINCTYLRGLCFTYVIQAEHPMVLGSQFLFSFI